MFSTRRDFLLASSGILGAFSSTGIAATKWEDKKPLEWSPRDIQTILNESAWVREASLESTSAALSSNDKSGKRDPAAGGIRDKRLIAGFKVLVRWESGLPIRLARKIATSPGDGGTHYTLSLSRLPLPFVAALSDAGQSSRGTIQSMNKPELAEQIRQTTSLVREGKDPIPADHAEWLDSDFESRIVFTFSPARQPIELADREVKFTSQVGSLIVRAPFPLRQMFYHGNLEL